MNETVVVQGRRLGPEAIQEIRELIGAHPEWSRRRLSQVLSAQWNWRNGAGRLKDMAMRSLLLKLEARGRIELPPRRQKASSRMASRGMEPCQREEAPLQRSLHELGRLVVREVSNDLAERRVLAAALRQFHYLGYRGSVGETLQYTIRDEQGRLLSGLVFGSAAWKCRARDEWIGWSEEVRVGRLHELTNNTRFLVLPWVQVPHLASWILGQVLGRLSSDWQRKYGHPIRLVETFVDRKRFAGTCYRAANWIDLGTTTGRTRQDRHHRLRVSTKAVYVYPLCRSIGGGLWR